MYTIIIMILMMKFIFNLIVGLGVDGDANEFILV